MQFPGRPDSTQSVVLRRNGDPEDRHHRIPDELLHRAAVPLEHDPRTLVVTVHQRAQRLGIGAVADRSRARQVAEENRDDLAYLTRTRPDRERDSTRWAEPKLIGTLPPTLCANRHGASLRPARSEPPVIQKTDRAQAVGFDSGHVATGQSAGGR